MRFGVALAVCVGVALAAGDAVACSCDAGVSEAWPENNQAGIAVNALILTSEVNEDDFHLREVETGLDVDGRFERLPDRWTAFRPTSPLRPWTQYRVEGLTDARGEPRELAFTTADATDETPPAFDGLAEVQGWESGVDARECWGSCAARARIAAVDLTWSLPPEAVYVLVEGRAGADAAWRTLAWTRQQADTLRLHSGSCGAGQLPDDFMAGSEYCLRAIAVDGAGNSAGLDVERCVQVPACEALSDLCVEQCAVVGPPVPIPDAAVPGAGDEPRDVGRVPPDPPDATPLDLDAGALPSDDGESRAASPERGGCATTPSPPVALAVGLLVFVLRRRRP
jgi:uncharacterized protein (TIGR03382 family)